MKIILLFRKRFPHRQSKSDYLIYVTESNVDILRIVSQDHLQFISYFNELASGLSSDLSQSVNDITIRPVRAYYIS